MWRLVFPVLSLVLFEAHLIFHGLGDWTLVPAALLFFLAVPKRYIAIMEGVFLIAMGAEWVRAACVLASERMAAGVDWHRGFAILIVCAFFTWYAAAVMLTGLVRQRYESGSWKKPQ